MNGKLNELKIDYTSRLQEIILGNTDLTLNITINLPDGDINNLDFSNINNVKTKLEALEKQYFNKLELKCNELKAKYTELLKGKDELAMDIKEQVDEVLSNLTEKDFVIKNYTDYKNLYIKIYTIEALSKGNKEGLKKILEDRYESYSTIINNLGLEINDIDMVGLKNKIKTFDKTNFLKINKTLDKIKESIAAKIQEINNNLKNKYDGIIKKIEYFNLNDIVEEIDLTPINTKIDENTKKETYDKLVNDINNLRDFLSNKLTELRSKYEEEINGLNAKLTELRLEGIILTNDLSNLTFDDLTGEIISNIESTITEAKNNCKTVEDYRNACIKSLEQVKNECNNIGILSNENISIFIENIEDNIKIINNETNKNNVDKLISDLKIKIEKANLVETIKEFINDEKFDITSENLNEKDFIKLLEDKLKIKHNEDESNKSTIGKT